MNPDQRTVAVWYLRAVVNVFEPWTRETSVIPESQRRAVAHTVTQARRGLAALDNTPSRQRREDKRERGWMPG